MTDTPLYEYSSFCYPFLHQWTLGLLPPSGSCESGCHEPGWHELWTSSHGSFQVFRVYTQSSVFLLKTLSTLSQVWLTTGVWHRLSESGWRPLTLHVYTPEDAQQAREPGPGPCSRNTPPGAHVASQAGHDLDSNTWHNLVFGTWGRGSFHFSFKVT